MTQICFAVKITYRAINAIVNWRKSFSIFLSILITPFDVNSIALQPFRVGIHNRTYPRQEQCLLKYSRAYPHPLNNGFIFWQISQHKSKLVHHFCGSPTLKPQWHYLLHFRGNKLCGCCSQILICTALYNGE